MMARNREVRKWQKINRELRLFGLGAVLVLLGFGWLTTLYFPGEGTSDVALAPGEDLRLTLADLELGRFHLLENGRVMLRAETLQEKAKSFLASVRVEAP